MKKEWLFPNAFVPVDVETTAALVAEIIRLIKVVNGMALAQPEQKYELVTYGEVWSSDGETWSRDGKVMDLAQSEERNFCPRCGKRTAEPTTIHTCTPPRKNT
jgi:hypothetical protein